MAKIITEKQQMVKSIEKRIKAQQKKLHLIETEFGEKAGATRKRIRQLNIQLTALKK